MMSTALQRTTVAADAATARLGALEGMANDLDRAAQRVRVLERRRAKSARAAFGAAARKRRRPPPLRRNSTTVAVEETPPRPPTAAAAEETPPQPPTAAAAEETPPQLPINAPKTLHEALATLPLARASTAPPPVDDADALAVAARARADELAQATEAVRAARLVAQHEPQAPQSFTSLVGDFLRPIVFAEDPSPDEPGGWLDVAAGGGWARRWCAVVSGPHGPALEISKSPGAATDDVALLNGCVVEASDDENGRFAFRVAHAHQRTRVLAARNMDTRRQWTSTLSGVARRHAASAREQDLAVASAAGRRLLAAERRLGVARERNRVEGG